MLFKVSYTDMFEVDGQPFLNVPAPAGKLLGIGEGVMFYDESGTTMAGRVASINPVDDDIYLSVRISV